jgi:hypothetical protein
LLTVLMGAVFLYVLFFVVRAGVEHGIRRALPERFLRPEPPGQAESVPGPHGEQV